MFLAFFAWDWHPPIGVFIGLLALVGVIVPWLKEQIGKREKAVWAVVMCALCYLEIRSIYADQAEHDKEQDRARKEQLDRFRKIGDGINKAISDSREQFDQTMTRVNAVITVQSQSLKTATGGNSFCYYLLAGPSDGKFAPVLLTKGEYPLYEVNARIVDLRIMQSVDGEIRSAKNALEMSAAIDKAQIIAPIGSLPVHASTIQRQISIPFYPDLGSQGFNVFFSARNGFWNEEIRLRHVDGKWFKAFRVTRGSDKRIMLIKADNGFPLDALGHPDFTF